MTNIEKQQLRSRMRNCLRELPQEHIDLASVAIAALLKNSDYFQSARCIFCYWPMPSEPQIFRSIIDQKVIGLPRIDGMTMNFFKVDLNTKGVYNKLGMHEPPESSVLLAPEDADIILLPGLAFDLKGGRLGRGGGYYDRFLENPKLRAQRIGVCFSCQIVEHIPREGHDQLMDAVITEEGMFRNAELGMRNSERVLS